MLNNKVVWISGASSGIGEATALLMAKKGYAVSVAARRMDKISDLSKKINDAGGKAIALKCDVSNEMEVKSSIEGTIETFGRLDALINNSGMIEVKMLHEYTTEQWDYIMNVNLKSMFYAFRYAYPHLKRNPRSYIVNVGSISSFVGQACTPVYTTSKHGVIGLTRSIALDYAKDGIRCNCVCPGLTDTPMLREHIECSGDAEKALSDRLKRVPLGVALSPEDVANSICFLASDEAAGITGTSLTIDCGYLTAAEWVNNFEGAQMQNSHTRIRSNDE